MRKKHVKNIVIDERYRLYYYKQKVVLREKKDKNWVPIFIGRFMSDVLDSSVISNEVKEKIKQKLSQIS